MQPKYFRVAVEGATVDGRTIQRQWLTQAAKNFNAEVRGARVWVEHLRSMWADSPFSAQGDVTALKAEEIKDGPLAGKMALFAAIKPLPELVELNKRGKKIYTSIEVEPKFADTGEAYVTGIAVTDDPASLGVEVLKFNARANPKKFSSEYHETTMEFAADADEAEEDSEAERAERKETKTMFARLMKRFRRSDGDNAQAAKVIDAMAYSIEEMQEEVAELQAENTKYRKENAGLAKQMDTLQTNFNALSEKLSKQDSNPAQRPAATGTEGTALADC
ncbi:GPO family capsid scaffolding protein [Acidovorax sp. GBBC 3334]|uniref:GPO family capsid scaffolding protein n=1 Tax=Acidovorax sp. GBBC 3334 TaxID=2940496 RepID=UPI00230314B6|nr:GPO family capsid scaffolding protein [Acidovorax sp. GBBC 3334]MDA8455244.1 GPO family capsid scaffolding protein [Acidovorax sp. GBBC 3334]